MGNEVKWKIVIEILFCYYSQSYKNHQTASYKLCLTNLSADFYMTVNSNIVFPILLKRWKILLNKYCQRQ